MPASAPMKLDWGQSASALVFGLATSRAPVDASAQSSGERGSMQEQTGQNAFGHLKASDSIKDLLAHPAFAGFAAQLLPWDGRAYDGRMLLQDIGALLPYHSAVNPKDVIAGLNRMVDDVNQGQTVFYDIYTEAGRDADPSKRNTGVFFYRGRPGAPFAVIPPGGGFAYVGSVHEGFPYAQEISRLSYNAFVLRYRAGYGGTVATEDLAAAISWIFCNADQLGVGTADFSVWGSSAGARMAAFIGSHGVAEFGGDDVPKPATVVMAYTAHSDHSDAEPPTFVVVGERDGIVPAASMERRIGRLQELGTEVEYHRYPNVGHGFGAGTGTSAEGWLAEAVRFWEAHLSPP
jgi:acetyl esterase/lipase